MDVRVAALADFANVGDNGKLNVMGIFSVLFTEGVPCMHPQMTLVVQLVFQSYEVGEKNVTITLHDTQGAVMLSLHGMMRVQAESNEDTLLVTSQIAQLNNLVFPTFGVYEFVIQIGDYVPINIPLPLVRSKQVK